MSIGSDLKKEGIEVTKELSNATVTHLAKNISEKFCTTFPEYNFNQADLFVKLCKLKMYMAKMPEGMAEANYFHKNSSIYFNDKIDLNDLEDFAIHECIHYLQEVKDKKNTLVRMGLSEYNGMNLYGLGINEASVQLITSKIIGIQKEYVKYFGINFETNSPSYYPLECALVNQLGFLIGEDILFESTINSNNNFKKTFSDLTSLKTYVTVQKSIDDILFKEEEIIILNNKIFDDNTNNKNISNYRKKIDELKNEITILFMKTQNLIISSYFDNEFTRITNLEQVENYRRKLHNFRSYIGITERYTYYDEYYIKKMDDLEKLYISIENGTFKTPNVPTVIKKNKFVEVLSKIKKFFEKLLKSNNSDLQENK